MELLGKFGKIVCWCPPPRIGAPTSGKSWIRHWSDLIEAPHLSFFYVLSSDGFSPKLTVSDDGTKILAVIGLNDFYVWEMDATEVLFSANQAGLQGTWSRVYSEGTSLPGNQAKGATCDATFFISEVSLVTGRNEVGPR